MYSTINDFIIDWKNESESTLKLLKALNDRSLSQTVTAEGRSLGFLAWHIVLTLGEMGGHAGLKVNAPKEDAAVPAKASAISSAYEVAANTLAEVVKKTWTDASLREEVDMYGEKWTRANVLSSLVKHEIHHRAQMTILMRQAGLPVPGLYGPSKEEWSKMGMPPMK